MITASLKQTIARRAKPKTGVRFTLLAGGRIRGVWEKKASVARLVAYGKKTPAGKERLAWLGRLKRKKILLAAAPAAVLLAILIPIVVSFSGSSVAPLELPAGRSVLLSGLGGAEPEEGEVEPEAAPLVLKKLKLSTYRVKAGDSLPGIAKKTNLDVGTLISFNAITDARSVTRGSTLSIPNHPGLRYRVRRGDSLSKLSRRFNVGLDDLLDWNNLPRSVITAGQSLFIPGGRLGAAEVNRVLGTLFAWPVRGSLSSLFGMRLSPITGTRMHHNGIDIHNAFGTPIKAAAAGRVAMVDYNPTYGNYIIIVHGNGFQSLYGHLNEIYVRKGTNVAQGERIAAMGSSGASTGSHLHFSIFKNGRDVDPLKYLR